MAEPAPLVPDLRTRRPRLRRLTVADAPELHDRGHGALLHYCFETLDTFRVEVEIDADNAPSLRLAERLGFRREMLLPDSLFPPGPHRPVWACALVRRD